MAVAMSFACSSVGWLSLPQQLSGGEAVDSPRDCNKNGEDDAVDVAGRASRDCNANGIPDECEVVPQYSAGVQGRELVGAADFDADGRSDLLALEWEEVVVHLARSGRRFVKRSTPVERWTHDAIVGDFDGDGRADVVRTGLDTVELLAGLGDGRFESVWTESLAGAGRGVAATDLEVDGDLDAVVIAAGLVVLLVNRGAVGFDVVSTEIKASVAAAGDLDGDGVDDLATLPPLTVHVNRGGLVFESLAPVPGFGLHDWLEIAPIFHRTDPRWIVAGGQEQITVANGNVDVGFRAFGLQMPADVVDGVFADFDGDSRRDAAFVLQGRGVEVVISRQGGFAHGRTHLPAGSAPLTIEAGDFDGDGDVDLAVGDACGGAISVLWNENGVLVNRDQISTADSVTADALVLHGDVDVDGDVDIVLEQDARYQTLLNDGHGSFSAGFSVEFVEFETPKKGRLEDVDGDAYPDLLLFGTQSLDVAHNTAGTGFVITQHVPLAIPDALRLVVDLESDGDADVVSYGSGWIDFAVNDGQGCFTQGKRFRVGGEPLRILAGRIDGDEFVDFFALVEDPLAPRRWPLRMFLNRGDSLQVSEFPLPARTGRLHAADVDGDGDTDLFIPVREPGSPQIDTLLRNQGGSFEPEVSSVEDVEAVSDLDGDGDVDVVSEDLTIGLNRGDGTFVWRPASFFPASGFGCGGTPPVVTSADFDGDGWSEIVVRRSTNHVALLRPQLEGLRDGDGDTLPDDCAAEFRRGDANGDGTIDAADASAILALLFASGEDFGCRAAEDVDDSGGVSISDAIALLSYLFRAGAAPHEPFAACGIDPTADVGCRAQRGCE